MKNDEQVIGEAVRIEYTEHDGKLFLVFEIINEKYKRDIKQNWTKDLEYKIVDKLLVKNNHDE
jgi:hypothetical protein